MSKSKTPAKAAGTVKPTSRKSAPAKKATKPTAAPKPEPPPAAPADPRVERLARWQAWAAQADAITELCEFIAGGGAQHNLNVWCQALGFNYTTVLKWLAADDERQRLYDRARELRADAIFDEIAQVANERMPITPFGSTDSGAVADKRLRIDTLKWMAGRLAPKRYGDKVAIGGAGDLPPIATKVDATLSPSDAYMKMIGKA